VHPLVPALVVSCKLGTDAVDDGESDVSQSDPTISQSKLVGLDVVLSTFDGTIIEEIARTDGGN